jgi:hypothetical protein
MNENEHPHPDELSAVEYRLRAGRAQLDPFDFDRIKQQVMARTRARPRRAGAMKSRLATFATVMCLGVGTSGAIAVACIGSPASASGGAAHGQYWPGKGCGDRNHDHNPFGWKQPCPGGGGNGGGGQGNGGGDHGYGGGDHGYGGGDHGYGGGDHGNGGGRRH